MTDIICSKCGKPYMAGLEYRIDGNVIRCKACHNKVIESRNKAFSSGGKK
jgi:DNA-directed RNA polymerase subunit RPC12/RpoP